MKNPSSSSIGQLPPEIADYICTFLRQSEISKLSLAAKSVYRLVRPILYRHPKINSFASLTLFNRTIARATFFVQEFIDQTKSMHLTLDSATDGDQPTAAVLISKNLQSIER